MKTSFIRPSFVISSQLLDGRTVFYSALIQKFFRRILLLDFFGWSTGRMSEPSMLFSLKLLSPTFLLNLIFLLFASQIRIAQSEPKWLRFRQSGE